MKKVPFSLTAIAMLAVFLFLGFAEQVPACTECICFEDNTCSNQGCTENLTANCTRTEFSPECDGDYTFKTFTECVTLDECDECQSCATLYKLVGATETLVAHCHTSGCNGILLPCEYECDEVNLGSDNTYVMYVCKVPCPGGPTCEDCGANCTAYACLSYGVLTCIP